MALSEHPAHLVGGRLTQKAVPQIHDDVVVDEALDLLLVAVDVMKDDPRLDATLREVEPPGLGDPGGKRLGGDLLCGA
jgi:hypothetical protein